jgi:hypothetical protein
MPVQSCRKGRRLRLLRLTANGFRCDFTQRREGSTSHTHDENLAGHLDQGHCRLGGKWDFGDHTQNLAMPAKGGLLQEITAHQIRTTNKEKDEYPE